MKISTACLVLISSIFLTSSAQASASCDEGCTDSSFTYCAHLRVYDDASQTWTELCSTPVAADGSYTFTNQDGSLQTQLASMADSKIGIFVSGGEAKGLAKRRKLLTQADLSHSNFTVSGQTTAEALPQSKLQEFYTAKQNAMTTLSNALQNERNLLVQKNIMGTYRAATLESSVDLLSRLSSFYGSFQTGGDQTNFFIFLKNQIDEIDSYSGPNSDLKEGLVGDVLVWDHYTIRGGVSQSDIAALLTTWTSILLRKDPTSLDQFANEFLSALNSGGKADLIPIGVRFRARMDAQLAALSVPNAATNQVLDPSLDVIDPDLRLMLHHLAYSLVRSLEDVGTLSGILKSFGGAASSACATSSPTGPNPEPCGLEPVLIRINQHVGSRNKNPPPGTPVFDVLPSDIADYVRIVFHGKFDTWLNKTVAMYYHQTYTFGAAQSALYSAFPDSIPGSIETDLTLLLPRIQNAFTGLDSSYSFGKGFRANTACSLDITDPYNANDCEEQALAAEMQLNNTWRKALTLTHPDIPVDTSSAADLDKLITYLSVAPLPAMPSYKFITGF